MINIPDVADITDERWLELVRAREGDIAGAFALPASAVEPTNITATEVLASQVEWRTREMPKMIEAMDAWQEMITDWYFRHTMIDLGIELMADEARREIQAMTAAAIARIGDLAPHPLDRYALVPSVQGHVTWQRVYTQGITPPTSITRTPNHQRSVALGEVWWLEEAADIDPVAWGALKRWSSPMFVTSNYPAGA